MASASMLYIKRIKNCPALVDGVHRMNFSVDSTLGTYGMDLVVSNRERPLFYPSGTVCCPTVT